jgi:4-amino-4-deoxy-L-arabinose transferase-like glycosyltransferase
VKFPNRSWPDRLPPDKFLVIAFVLGYLLWGLIDHDPWRVDDVVALSIAHGFSVQQWTVVPLLAGEPWLGSPPLYHWLAALFGNVLSVVLPWHAGARLASALILGAGLYALSNAVRRLYGDDAERLAPLLAAGTLGLMVPAHEAQPALISFLAITWQLAALAHWGVRPVVAPISLGLALGVGFLGSGLSSLLPMLGILCAAALHPRWRRNNRAGWIYALAVAIPLLIAWPLALGEQDAGLLHRWWSSELQSLGGDTTLTTKRLEMLSWAAWPVLPLSLWLLWLERRRLTDATNFIAFAGLAITLLFYLRSNEPAHALFPMLAMLSLLAAPAAGRLRRGAANAFDWFGAMSLTIFMALIWLGGVAILTGLPARVAKNFSKPAPGFIPEWSWLAFATAVVVSLLWLRLLVTAPRSPWRAASRWSFGIVVVWILLVTLWMPWIDYGKSYRGVSADLRQALGKTPGCIERKGLDDGHRASLDYFSGIRTIPGSGHSGKCRFLIARTTRAADKHLPGWTLKLERSRPGDRKESLRLYQRNV